MITLSHFDFLFCLTSRGAASAAFEDGRIPLAVTTETPEKSAQGDHYKIQH
jgi:hypothetical protein